MSTREVVEYIAQSKLIQECILVVTGGVWRSEYDDLTQDVLIELLNQEKIISLYQKGQLKYFIMRIIRNNIQSNTSRFFYRYRRFSLLNSGDKALESYGQKEEM